MSFEFILPAELRAKEPPEKRGIPRDKVRLMVINRIEGTVIHSRFDHLISFLKSGDLLVFNSSRTLPAILNGIKNQERPGIEVRLAERLPDGSWLCLLLCVHEDPFECGLRVGMTIHFSHELQALVLAQDERISRLWKIRFSKNGSELIDLIYKLGRPIRYEYVSGPWDLEYYQTVYAKDPGSAEMPSAGRAFTWKMLFDLKNHGIDTAYLTLHTGLSSYMDDELDRQHLIAEEELFIGKNTADKINHTHEKGGRIIAVGTTVVRAIESSVQNNGKVKAGHDYTRLHITGNSRLKIVDALLTGMHEPEASHLDLLAAFLPPDKIKYAYETAVQLKYLWHEFGDLNLII